MQSAPTSNLRPEKKLVAFSSLPNHHRKSLLNLFVPISFGLILIIAWGYLIHENLLWALYMMMLYYISSSSHFLRFWTFWPIFILFLFDWCWYWCDPRVNDTSISQVPQPQLLSQLGNLTSPAYILKASSDIPWSLNAPWRSRDDNRVRKNILSLTFLTWEGLFATTLTHIALHLLWSIWKLFNHFTSTFLESPSVCLPF